ncbi:MAG: indole-3-glycerol phosphate synthase TrpC [Gammaproteobacteria bacterium]
MSDTPDILQRILSRKVEELAQRCQQVSLREVGERAAAAPPVRPFAEALEARINQGQPAVIAEIKRASPSKGILREAFDPAGIAAGYERGGATALSVLTDQAFFQGSDANLQAARAACSLPCLRKDFIIDPYQVYEARAISSDCILLIVSALGDAQLRELADLATYLGMDVLPEVHDAEELERALALATPLIGINNRNLHTFQTSLETTLNLIALVPQNRIVIAESGIHHHADIARLRAHGVHTFLVGETLMIADDPGARLKELFYMD